MKERPPRHGSLRRCRQRTGDRNRRGQMPGHGSSGGPQQETESRLFTAAVTHAVQSPSIASFIRDYIPAAEVYNAIELMRDEIWAVVQASRGQPLVTPNGRCRRPRSPPPTASSMNRMTSANGPGKVSRAQRASACLPASTQKPSVTRFGWPRTRDGSAGRSRSSETLKPRSSEREKPPTVRPAALVRTGGARRRRLASGALHVQGAAARTTRSLPPNSSTKRPLRASLRSNTRMATFLAPLSSE